MYVHRKVPRLEMATEPLVQKCMTIVSSLVILVGSIIPSFPNGTEAPLTMDSLFVLDLWWCVIQSAPSCS